MVSPGIVIPKIISPNGDGVNDRFITTIIQEAYPNAKISIFDRYGKKMAEYKGADEGWDGTYNGKPMKSTDYWYEIEVKEKFESLGIEILTPKQAIDQIAKDYE